jgi:FkbH-like protein
MFQFDWATEELWSEESENVESRRSKLPTSDVQGIMLLHWQEHCVECALPLCYTNCPLYVKRRDQKCARFVYGIVRNHDFSGLLPCGADLRFRRWGKLEAQLTGRYISVSRLRLLDRADRIVTSIIGKLADVLSGIDPKRRVQGALTKYRGDLLQHLGQRGTTYDDFVVECYSFHSGPCKLIVELRQQGISVFRESVNLKFGYNFCSLPIQLPPEFEGKDGYTLMLYPADDLEVRLVFTWLDFVVREHIPVENSHQLSTSRTAETEITAQPAEKVKCVAWDLDNTLWQGVLVEDGEQNIRLRPEAVELVHRLDERGIIQTIVSKNNQSEAMSVLRRYGLEEYFLYPAINWGQKSINLQQVAERLNINVDTFALIDDSPFERREVSVALPTVRVYPEDSLAQMLDRPEFDVPVTETSRIRRQSYVIEAQREQAKELFGANYLDFLRSCELRLRVFPPTSNQEIARCLELIQRSNQLNLSSRRYNGDQFKALLNDGNMLSVAMECEDKFGNYGIVGFASIDMSGEVPVAKDFVLSCRVAQKRVEHAFYGWLGAFLKQQGASQLRVELIKTAKNRPLVQVFEEMPFITLSVDGDKTLLSMELNGTMPRDSVVALDDAAFSGSRVL